MGHIEIVGLRTRRTGVRPELFLRQLLASRDTIKIVRDADDLHCVSQMRVGEGSDDFCVELYRPGLARHMRRLAVTDQPLLLGIDPGVEALIENQLKRRFGGRKVENMAFDHRQRSEERRVGKECGSRWSPI